MKLSQNGVNFIKSHEALRLKAYQDSKGVWTIGWRRMPVRSLS